RRPLNELQDTRRDVTSALGCGAHRCLDSFPTRRSSDLPGRPAVGEPLEMRIERERAQRLDAQQPMAPGAQEIGITHRQACVACRSEEHTSELQSQSNLVCRLLLEQKIRRRGAMRRARTA